jgi:aspartyl-tRNA(Asn)/glutamyl-tRNA(Gln) amidotransferase subunit B
VTDEGAIAVVVDRVLSANAGKVAEYRAGKEKLLGFFVGQVMKESAGKASPEVVNRLLKDKLAGG